MAKSLREQDVRTAESIFRDFLHRRGLKYTSERQMVLREVLDSEGHFEAEELLITLRQRGRRVAKATIYRTLPLLVHCGIIMRVQFGDNLARYEHTFGQSPHDHMICQRCHRIIEFDSADVVRLRTAVAAHHTFHPVAHRFQITGLCRECAQACPAAERPFVPSDIPAGTSRARRRSGGSRR